MIHQPFLEGAFWHAYITAEFDAYALPRYLVRPPPPDVQARGDVVGGEMRFGGHGSGPGPWQW